MKYIVAVMSTVLLLAIMALGQAQSLADIADQEKQRREEIQEAPEVITNDNVSEYENGSVSTIKIEFAATEKDSENSEGGAKAAEQDKEVDPDEPTDLTGRTETFWRETATEAHRKVKILEDEALALTLRMNDLQNQYYNVSDGFDRDGVQKNIQKTFYEQDQNKENLAKAKDELEDLVKEAQKSGAPPGWLR